MKIKILITTKYPGLKLTAGETRDDLSDELCQNLVDIKKAEFVKTARKPKVK